MGVQGLTSFIKANKDRMITGYHLHDTYLVIDGNNFLYRLYENSNNQTKDNIYGGNYSRFAGNVHRFFTTLAKCRIRPVVVMDGGIDPSDQKIVKLLKKFTKNLRHAIDISNGNHFDGNIDIHPTLCRPVLEQMMDQLGVAYCQILYEADTYAAALANQLNCPILSGDSDFFVYNIIGGVILSDYLMNSMQVRQYEDQNNWRNRETYKYLDTKLYTIDNFVKCFPGLTSDCLPVFSTLMGNDYIEYDNIRPIVDTIPDVNNGQRNNRINISERHQQMIKILNWLRGLTRQQVIDYIESVLIEKSMNNVIELLKISIESYNIDNCSDGISYDRATNSFNWSKLAAHVMQKVLAFPQWFAIDMCKSRLNPMLINVSQAKRVFLSPRVEDLSLPSTYKCCWRLRQYLIGLMREDNDNDVKTVEVYDRYESEYKVLSMQSITVLTNNSGHQLPQLNQIINLTINEKTNLISEMLFDDKNVVKFMIKNTIKISDLQNQEGVYLMIVIRYWLGNTPNQIWYEFLYSLMICILFTGHFNYDDDYDNYQSFKLISLVDRKQKHFLNSLNSLLINRNYPFISRIVHYFNEFQDCLTSIRCVNRLFGSPVPMGCPDMCLNGPLIYNLTVKLTQTNSPLNYLKQMLGPMSANCRLFERHLQLVLKYISNDKMIWCPRDVLNTNNMILNHMSNQFWSIKFK